jgi:hypothetical protein
MLSWGRSSTSCPLRVRSQLAPPLVCSKGIRRRVAPRGWRSISRSGCVSATSSRGLNPSRFILIQGGINPNPNWADCAKKSLSSSHMS